MDAVAIEATGVATAEDVEDLREVFYLKRVQASGLGLLTGKGDSFGHAGPEAGSVGFEELFPARPVDGWSVGGRHR